MLCAPSRRVEILRSNQVVFSTSLAGGTGPVAFAKKEWPMACGKTVTGLNGPQLCYWLRYAAQVDFVIGNAEVRGDEIRILTENVPGQLDRFSEFSLHAAGLEELRLVHAEVGSSRRPTLEYLRAGDALALSWTPGHPRQILQSADSVSGPWINVPGLTSPPYIAPNTDARKFHRIVRP